MTENCPKAKVPTDSFLFFTDFLKPIDILALTC